MAIIWRGFGIAIPILIGIAALVLSFFYDDTRLGNLNYTGWILISAAIPMVLVALATFGGGEDEEGGEDPSKWTDHTLFFIPVALWVLILAGGGIYCLMNAEDAPESPTPASSASTPTTPTTPTTPGDAQPSAPPVEKQDLATAWIAKLEQTLGCPTDDANHTAWCTAAQGWGRGSAASIGTGDQILLGIAVELSPGQKIASALAAPSLSVLALRNAEGKLLGSLTGIKGDDAQQDEMIASTLASLSEVFTGSREAPTVAADLEGYLRTLPGAASQSLERGEAGWTIAQTKPVELRKVGKHWVVFETHPGGVGFLSIHALLPAAN